MYKHILIRLTDDEREFFNVPSFYKHEESNSFILLSQNGNYHIFPTENVVEVVVG